MKEILIKASLLFTGLIIIIAIFGCLIWTVSTYQLNHGWQPSEPTKYCEGYYVDRRFGIDEYVGTDINEARLLAGENIIYYDTQVCH